MYIPCLPFPLKAVNRQRLPRAYLFNFIAVAGTVSLTFPRTLDPVVINKKQGLCAVGKLIPLKRGFVKGLGNQPLLSRFFSNTAVIMFN